MTSKRLIISIAAILLVSSSESFRILVYFPLHSKSHGILGQGIVSRLLEAGHEVVHVTSFPREKPVANLTEISLFGLVEKIKSQLPHVDKFKIKNLVGKGNIGESIFFMNMIHGIQRKIIEDDTVINFLKDPTQKFDAVIPEWFFSDEMAGFAALYQCPLIWFGSTEAHWQILKLVDEIPNPSYNADLFSLNRPPFSFLERLSELYTIIKRTILFEFTITASQKALYNKVFGEIAAERGVIMPSYEDAVYNGSLLLLNSHPSIGTPYRLPQNAKYIAGYHIDTVKPLPKDLQKTMDEAKHGVIYFSMGSNIKSMDMSDHMRDSILNIFGKLKQTVIWKYEGDIDKVPANVHLVKWAPQLSILAHPNLKFFITHGGQLSTTEAIHFGVPVIGIPVFGDQYVNMKSVTNKGIGLTVTLAEDMAKYLQKAIEEMLRNSSYATKAKELSFVYHNRQLTPGQELVFWVEHVINTKGAPHLRSPALTLPFYKRMYLDFILLIIIIVIILKNLISRMCRREIIRKSKSD